MANVIIRPEWHISEKHATPEHVYRNRRKFLRELGLSAGALSLLNLSSRSAFGAELGESTVKANLYPAKRNAEFNPTGWKISDEKIATRYNNFYEFSTSKTGVLRLADKLTLDPWPIEIGGLVENPLKVDAQELIAMFPLEERVYRFRCVEAWAMIVPWTGFQLSKLVEKVKPKPEAKFIKFVTFLRPNEAPGQLEDNYPWPYTEGLRIDEAMNPLSFVGAGIYGKPMPKQMGAPIRTVIPWKYGYKSIKSFVKIEFTSTQPKTLWETLAPHEYPFESNVNPGVPHPRWSQATERMVDTGDRVRTQMYNGYGNYVAKLYKA